jgi:hypothetical protein
MCRVRVLAVFAVLGGGGGGGGGGGVSRQAKRRIERTDGEKKK